MKVIICLLMFCVTLFAQGFGNISTEVFEHLKYDVATDSYAYTSPAILYTYLQVTNITDTTIMFETPTMNMCYFRVMRGRIEIDAFPRATMPAIGTFVLEPGESAADTASWEIIPAHTDTIYQMWAILNIGTGWSDFPRDSHFVEFKIGETSVIEYPKTDKASWSVPNPVRNAVYLSEQGEYELFDIRGRSIVEVKGPATIDTRSLAQGTYIIRRDEEYQRILILK